MRKSHIIVVAALAVVLVLLSVFVLYTRQQHEAANTDAARTLVVTEETPFVTRAGQPFSFQSYDDTVRVVTAWASWSPDAKEQLRAIDEIASQYGKESVSFIAINRKEPKHRIEAFLSSLEPPLTNVQIIVDQTDAYFSRIEGYAMPETVVYDQEGTIISHIRGPFDPTEITELLQENIER